MKNFTLKKAVFLSFVFSFSGATLASKIDDPIGNVYPIQEESFLEYIQKKLIEKQKSGELKKLEEEFKKRAIHSLNNPRGVDLPRATKTVERKYDTTVTLNKDILLPDGRVMYKAGTKFNPLLIRGLSKKLIFIDGRDPEQVKFAINTFKSSGSRDKIILVAGSFMDFMKKYKIRCYFDQNYSGDLGNMTTLVDKFGIKFLPSIVYQKRPNDPYLTIKEVSLDAH